MADFSDSCSAQPLSITEKYTTVHYFSVIWVVNNYANSGHWDPYREYDSLTEMLVCSQSNCFQQKTSLVKNDAQTEGWFRRGAAKSGHWQIKSVTTLHSTPTHPITHPTQYHLNIWRGVQNSDSVCRPVTKCSAKVVDILQVCTVHFAKFKPFIKMDVFQHPVNYAPMYKAKACPLTSIWGRSKKGPPGFTESNAIYRVFF